MTTYVQDLRCLIERLPDWEQHRYNKVARVAYTKYLKAPSGGKLQSAARARRGYNFPSRLALGYNAVTRAFCAIFCFLFCLFFVQCTVIFVALDMPNQVFMLCLCCGGDYLFVFLLFDVKFRDTNFLNTE